MSYIFLCVANTNNSTVPVDDIFEEAKNRDLCKRLRLQSLANLLWSQAKLGNKDLELTNKLLDVYVQNHTNKPGEYFPPLALSNTLVGLAILFPNAGAGAWEEGREDLKSTLAAQIATTPQFDEVTQAAIKTLGLEPSKK